MDLATLDLVKVRLCKTDTEDDADLLAIIASYSAEFARWMCRHVETIQRTESYKVKGSGYDVCLKGYPVQSVVSVKFAGKKKDLPSAFPVLADDFDVDLDSGILEVCADSSFEPLYVEVTYTGGMGADTTEFIANYPDLAEAMALQVCEHWRRKNDPSKSSVTDFGSETRYDNGELGILKRVKPIIMSHRSFNI